MKKRNCTICLAKTKVLICAFVFAYACCWFSLAEALLPSELKKLTINNLAGMQVRRLVFVDLKDLVSVPDHSL